MNTPGENSNNLSSIFFDYELVLWVKIEDAISNVVFKTRIIILYSLTFRKRCFKKNSPLSFKKIYCWREGSIKINSTLDTHAADRWSPFIYTKSGDWLTIRIPALNNWPLTILNIRKYILIVLKLWFLSKLRLRPEKWRFWSIYKFRGVV
jgi:hypothetical protein